MSLPITYLYPTGGRVFEKYYSTLTKKIRWYCFGKKRKSLTQRCNTIASRKAAHAMYMIDKPIRDMEKILAEAKLQIINEI